jgi:hypothetical protein
MSTKPESAFDKRIIARNIKRGKVTRKEYDQVLESLPDVSNKSIAIFTSPDELEDEELEEEEEEEEEED